MRQVQGVPPQGGGPARLRARRLPAVAAATVAVAAALAVALARAAAAAPDAPAKPSPSSKPPATQTAQPAEPKPVTPPATAPPTAPSRPKATVVWTAEDLERLRQSDGTLNWIGDGHEEPMPQLETAPARPGEDVLERYAELAGHAEAELQRLQRERLAAVNPYLRGLARDASGAPTTPRDPAQIDAEIARWQARRAEAQANLRQTADLLHKDVPAVTPDKPASTPPTP